MVIRLIFVIVQCSYASSMRSDSPNCRNPVPRSHCIPRGQRLRPVDDQLYGSRKHGACAILNDATANKGMTILEARARLKDASLEAYELSPLLIEEIRTANCADVHQATRDRGVAAMIGVMETRQMVDIIGNQISMINVKYESWRPPPGKP